MNLRWLFKMAWRDSRRNKKRLLLFMSSIVLGIGALVAINAFGENLSLQINTEAKELLGADLEVKDRTPIPEEIYQLFDSLGFELAREINFASMVYFPKDGGTRLVNVRALDPGFPFYGTIQTNPEGRAGGFAAGQHALVDQTLLLQFDAEPGEDVRVGEVTFKIAGGVVKVPGQSAITTTVAPPVFIPLSLIDATGLMQKGSRFNYLLYAKYPAGFDNKLFEEVIKPRLDKTELQYDDVSERKDEVGEAYGDLTGFLNLTAFVALLLGCLGVAGSVHIYMKEKVQSVAIMRCLGASGKQAMGIYVIQIILMGVVGSSIGALLGTTIQYYLPTLFNDFLPFEVDLAIGWMSIFQGIALGVVASLLFSLFPLLRIRRISPLKAIRASFEKSEKDRLPYLVFAGILLFVAVFSYVQLGNFVRAMVFTAGLILALAILAGAAQLIIWLVRRFFPVRGSFILRQSLANLYRPNNQTLILVITIGLGTALITTLLLSKDLLVDKVKFTSAPESRPNMVLFDIQTDQLEGLDSLTSSFDLPLMGEVPIVTMRLHSLRGNSVESLRADTTSGMRSWVLNREYRVTYRDSMTDSEKLLDGKWMGIQENADDSIFISVEEGLAEDMQAGLGDEIVFNVQGALLTTYIGSIRKIDWQRMQTNFLVVFPEGILEKAPKFHVLLTRFDSTQQSADYQRAVVQQYPNVSIIDLDLILTTVDAVLGKVSFVIQFMAFFSIITGVLVLIGSVIISKFQRVQESVLLRTLGANRKQILLINTFEYFLLGSIAALTGILIALIAGSLLAYFSFNTVLRPDWVVVIISYLAITILTVGVGMSNSRDIIRKPPLEILRREG